MGLFGRGDRPICESCRRPHAPGVRYDQVRRKHLCRSCWQVLGPPAGTPAHPEDRPGWKVEVRRRLD
jgi:hypothetical protein